MKAKAARAKHEKGLARRRRLAEKARYQASRAYFRDYPDVVFHPGDAPEGFVRLVREAAAAVRMDDSALFSKEESREFRRLKKEHFPAWPSTVVKYGDRLFEYAGQTRLAAYIPFNDVTITMRPGALDARFSALRRHKGPGGTAYYSPHEPTLEVAGRQHVVAFSTHAALRVCERAVPTWRTYGGLGDAYGLLDGTLEYESCLMPDGRVGFSFFGNCCFWLLGKGRGIPRSAGMAIGVLGHDLVPGRKYSYRIGYCPAVVEGRFIKAKTLLYPGQRGTPEHELIRRREPDPAERRRKLEAAERLDAAYVCDNLDFELLRWFHANGILQVVEREVRFAGPFSAKGRR